MPHALKEQLNKIFQFFLDTPDELTNRSKEIKELANKTKQNISKAEKDIQTLKNDIVEKFLQDSNFKDKIYNIICTTRQKQNQPSSTLQELQNNTKKLLNEVTINLKDCTLQFDPNLTEEQYNQKYNVQIIADSFLTNPEVYINYIKAIKENDYYIFFEEIPILVSLANTEITLYYENNKHQTFKPNHEFLGNYQTNTNIWGTKEKAVILYESTHYSYAEEPDTQEQYNGYTTPDIPASNLSAHSINTDTCSFNSDSSLRLLTPNTLDTLEKLTDLVDINDIIANETYLSPIPVSDPEQGNQVTMSDIPQSPYCLQNSTTPMLSNSSEQDNQVINYILQPPYCLQNSTTPMLSNSSEQGNQVIMSHILQPSYCLQNSTTPMLSNSSEQGNQVIMSYIPQPPYCLQNSTTPMLSNSSEQGNQVIMSYIPQPPYCLQNSTTPMLSNSSEQGNQVIMSYIPQPPYCLQNSTTPMLSNSLEQGNQVIMSYIPQPPYCLQNSTTPMLSNSLEQGNQAFLTSDSLSPRLLNTLNALAPQISNIVEKLSNSNLNAIHITRILHMIEQIAQTGITSLIQEWQMKAIDFIHQFNSQQLTEIIESLDKLQNCLYSNRDDNSTNIQTFVIQWQKRAIDIIDQFDPKQLISAIKSLSILQDNNSSNTSNTEYSNENTQNFLTTWEERVINIMNKFDIQQLVILTDILKQPFSIQDDIIESWKCNISQSKIINQFSDPQQFVTVMKFYFDNSVEVLAVSFQPWHYKTLVLMDEFKLEQYFISKDIYYSQLYLIDNRYLLDYIDKLQETITSYIDQSNIKNIIQFLTFMNYAEAHLYHSNLSININGDFIIKLQKHSIRLINSHHYDPQLTTNLSYICKLDEQYIDKDFIIELQKHSIRLINSHHYDPQLTTNLSYICKLDEQYIDKDFIIELQKHSIRLINSYYDPQLTTNFSYICKLDEQYIDKDFIIELQKHSIRLINSHHYDPQLTTNLSYICKLDEQYIDKDFIIKLQKHSIRLINSYYDPQLTTNLSYICKLDEQYIDKDFIIKLQKHSIRLINSYYDPQLTTNLSYICKLDEQYIDKDFIIKLQKHITTHIEVYDILQLEDCFFNICTQNNIDYINYHFIDQSKQILEKCSESVDIMNINRVYGVYVCKTYTNYDDTSLTGEISPESYSMS
ncbi:hypothetical protein [Rickettsia endosymbiont of Orchestes rusci]|uniref:hypothetical protein n=1 Tax=Rickettsia endosymbiont of Orchestes rusci TaxID=3066250 RepID=UPI00313C2BAD